MDKIKSSPDDSWNIQEWEPLTYIVIENCIREKSIFILFNLLFRMSLDRD